MKITYSPPNVPGLTIEFEADTPTALIAGLAGVQEITQEKCCGLCSSENIRFEKRLTGEEKDNLYLEIRCGDCDGLLDIGQRKGGKGLWLKKRKGGQAMPNGGWYIYTPTAPDGHIPSQRQQISPQQQQPQGGMW